MSWIKNFFQRFKNDDEDRDVNDYLEEANDEQASYQKKSHSGGNGNSRVNAKVFYQYPKGQFKFPLIPDQKPEVRKRTPKDQKQVNYIETEQFFHNEKPLREQSVRNGRQVEIEKKPARTAREDTTRKSDRLNQDEQHEKKKTGVIQQSRRPFRPTEIPSPIYGFNRPKRNEAPNKEVELETVEFELDSFVPEHQGFTKMQEDTVPQVNDHYNDCISSNDESFELQAEVKHKLEETTLDSNEEMKQLEYEILTNFDEVAASEEVLVEESECIKTDEVNLESEQADSLTSSNEHEEGINSIESSEMVDMDQSFEEQKDSQINKIELEEEIEQRESQVMSENESFLEELSAQQVDLHIDSREKPFDEVDVHANSTNDEKQSEMESHEQKRRTHIPFNVIMLKQDKMNWEKKKEKEEITIDESFVDEEDQHEDAFGRDYLFPSDHLLKPPAIENINAEWLGEQEQLLNQTLINFNVGAKVVNVTKGPSVTRFEVQPEPGVKVNKITNLTDDIKLSLAARDIRIEAPIPGKHTIGIEVPNETSRPVFISEIINSPEFKKNESALTAVLGLDISGKPIVTDLRKMPHGLIAGATGSGKSVCINSILVSLLYKANPSDLKLLLIDPKMVELAPYNQIPHLVSPVITDVKAATAALKWAVEEMERRYELFAHTGVRDITRFNELAEDHKRYADKLPYIVIVIDELADLMMMSPTDVEEAICRIAQKARACGIHLIIATQRPSVDVITGLIKANVPTRIAFSVSSQVDSRTIIDIGGAEKLLGRGDMLFLENGSSKPVRLQGTYVSDQEIDAVVAHVREQKAPEYLFQQEELLKKAQISEEEDELFYEACGFVVDQGSASTSSLQRNFRIGYNRAARLIDMMEQQGIISEARGSKPRDVLISETELEMI